MGKSNKSKKKEQLLEAKPVPLMKKSCNDSYVSTRLYNDDCAYSRRVMESTAPIHYRMDYDKHVNPNRFKYPGVENDTYYDLVQVESDLWNINRKATSCPEKKYRGSKVSYKTRKDVPPVWPYDKRDFIGPYTCEFDILSNGLPPLKNTSELTKKHNKSKKSGKC